MPSPIPSMLPPKVTPLTLSNLDNAVSISSSLFSNVSLNLGLLPPQNLQSYPLRLTQQEPHLILPEVFEAGREIWTSEGEAKELAKKDFIEIMKQLERALGDKSFYGGDAFGFVDIIAIGLTSWFVAYEKFGGFNVEDHCPKFSAWMKRCMQRETVYLCWECNKTSTPEEHLNLALDFQVPNALPKTFYLNMMARQSTLSHTAVGSRFYRIEARPAPWPCNVVLLVSETKRDALDPVSFKR
ncbi:putative glutathione s-transferase [Quercus suber]|uniref:Glutathione S-transferase n=1 Tax=Quercus suber TaxID=58331 RepID=A0AAW0IZS7_QUESU